mgnify:CR=1 FL=1
MKTIILTAAMLASNLIYSQIGVLTLKKNDLIYFGMWYTIAEKGRENNLYITYDDEDMAIYKLEQILSEFDVLIEEPTGTDEDGDSYWTVEQENGFISDVYYIREKNFPYFTITITSIPNE